MNDAAPAPIDALRETVERLWPDAASVEVVGRGSSIPPRGAVVELLAVPNAASPRILVPSSGRAAAAAMQRYSAALRPREVVQRSVLGLALSAGGTGILRDRIRITEPGDDHIVAVVEEMLGQPVTVSLGIGTVRANRKPVLGVFDRTGSPLAFVKVGDSAVAAGHVRGEVDALEAVAGRTWTILQPPELLGHRRWRGMEVLVMSALRPRPWDRQAIWPAPLAAMQELSSAFSGGEPPLSESPMWQRCEKIAAGLAVADARDELQAAMSRVRATFGDVAHPVGAWHGDFTPWNMARTGDRVLLWDWERFETGVPEGFDRMHYAVNATTRALGTGVAPILEGLRRGAGSSAAWSTRESLIAASYLVSLSCRYLAAAEDEGGDAIAPRARTVLTALSGLSEHLAV